MRIKIKIRFLFSPSKSCMPSKIYTIQAAEFRQQCFSSSGRRTDRVSDVEPHKVDGPTVHGRARGLPTRQEISPPVVARCVVWEKYGETWGHRDTEMCVAAVAGEVAGVGEG